MPKPAFSVCVVARNEAETLPKRLSPSLKPFLESGGDAILLDTGSTDDTAAIAESLGWRVFREGDKFRLKIDDAKAKAMNDRFVVDGDPPIVNPGDSIFDFATARNESADRAENNHCLVAGCDEAFTTLDIDAVNSHCVRGLTQGEAYYVHDHDHFGKARTHFYRIVLYDRRAGQWTGVVHEVVSGNSPVTRLPTASMRIDHWQQPNENRNGYLPGLAWDCFENQHKDRQSHYFARELLYSRRYKSAIKEFERHIGMTKAWHTEQAQSMTFIGDCLIHLGDAPGGVACYHKSFDMESSRREPLIRLAWHYYQKGDHQRTAAYANAALTIPLVPCYCNQLDHYRHLPHELLYWALWYLGDRAGAKQHWLKCIEYQPTNQKFVEEARLFNSVLQ